MPATGYAGNGDLSRVAKAGDTMSGLLVLSGDPVQPLGAATEQYVLAHAGGGSGTVKSVNNQSPDSSGNVQLTPAILNALPVSSAGVPGGLATLDGGGHLLAAQSVLLLAVANNLSELSSSASQARTNLGLGSAAVLPSSAFLQPPNNLSDVSSAGAARTNLGLGSAATVALGTLLQVSNNLSDLSSAGAARSNLGLGSAALQSSSSFLQPGNNLSDLTSAGAARTNLGLGSAATVNLGTLLQVGNNLSDVSSAAVARTNLGLGSAATLASSAFLQPVNNLSDLTSAAGARTNLGLGSAAVQATSAFLLPGNNLSDVSSAGSARANLGLGSAAVVALSSLLQAANNLSELASAGTARTNLGLGTAALLASGAVAQTANNLSDLSSAGTARANLGLTLLATASFDIVAADFQPVGLAGAGTTGKVADAGHTHPYWPWQFPITNYGAVGDGHCVVDGFMSSGSNVLGSNTAAFSSAMNGMAVMVKGALVSGQTTGFGTISAVTSTTSATLSFSATTAVTSAQVCWGTDNTSAIQQAIAAAFTYGQTHGLDVEIITPPSSGLFWAVAGPLKQTDGVNAFYNSQLTIPIQSDRNPKLTLSFRGNSNSGNTRHWNQDYPAFGPSTWLSFGAFDTAAHQSNSGVSAVSNAGNPSVLGGPTGKNGYGVSSANPLYNNVLVELRGLTILTTHSASGWTYSPFNFHGCAGASLVDCSFGTTGVVQLYKGGSGDFTSVSTLSGGISIGGLLPGAGNNASNRISNCVWNGGYTYGPLLTEHTVFDGLTILYCWSGFCPVGTYGDGGTGTGALHAVAGSQLCVEACSYHVNVFGAGASSIGPIVHTSLDTEGSVQLRDNPSNGSGLAAFAGEIRLNGSPSSPSLTFPSNIRIIKEVIQPGPVAAPPAVVLNTLQQNTFWRNALVVFSSGANVTGISVSNQAGATSAALVSQYSQAAGALPAPGVPVRIGPGCWYQVAASSASPVPAAAWTLD